MPVSDPHSFTDLDQGRITHVDLRLDVDFETRTMRGTAHYTLEGPSKGSLSLDSHGLQLERLHVGGRDLRWELDRTDPILGERLHVKDLGPSTHFTAVFSTSPDASALQWVEPQQTAGGVHPFLYSQCQPIQARSIFPCQDTPAVRFTFRAEVRIPKPYLAVMSAASEAIDEDGDHRRCRFQMPQPVPSYLFALAVGNLAWEDLGPRCRVYAEPEIVEAAAWEFADTEAQLQVAEGLFGPYLWDRYDMLVLPPSFPYGGMENPRLTFLTPTLLVGDRSLTNVVIHELAHSWTGNLVTNATWEDFWLNEGWTTYAERRILEVTEGRDFAQLKAAIGRNKMFEYMHYFGMDSDLTCLKLPQKDTHPDAVLTTIAYEKGYSFLVLVETAVGREAFDAFIQSYIKDHQFKSLTTEEFVTYLKQKLPQAATQVDIDGWLYGTGFPSSASEFRSALMDDVVTLATRYEDGHLPTVEEVHGWKPAQTELFLQSIPSRIPMEDCRALEALFGIETSRNDLFLSAYLSLAVRSGDQEALPLVERFVANVGRILYLRPIYLALANSDWAREEARPMFERVRPRYHPLTAAAIQRILTKAGL